MNTGRIDNYAPKARRDFIAAVALRAAKFGLAAKGASPVYTTSRRLVTPTKVYRRRLSLGGDRVC